MSQAMKGNIDVEHPTATTPKLKISPRNFTPTHQIYEENVDLLLCWEEEENLFYSRKICRENRGGETKIINDASILDSNEEKTYLICVLDLNGGGGRRGGGA